MAGTEATVSRMVVAMAVAVADMATIAEGTIMARIEAVGDAAVGGRRMLITHIELGRTDIAVISYLLYKYCASSCASLRHY